MPRPTEISGKYKLARVSNTPWTQTIKRVPQEGEQRNRFVYQRLISREETYSPFLMPSAASSEAWAEVVPLDEHEKTGLRSDQPTVEPMGPGVSAVELIVSHLENHNDPISAAECICLVEEFDLDREQIKRIIPLLYSFVREHRDSVQPEIVTGVAAAIRFIICSDNLEDVDNISDLLDPGHRSVLTVAGQIEVAKMLARRVTVDPIAAQKTMKKLHKRLDDLVAAYLSPYVLNDSQRAAVALNSLQVLAVLNEDAFKKHLASLAGPWCKWFRDHLNARLGKMLKAWNASQTNPEMAGEENRLAQLQRLI